MWQYFQTEDRAQCELSDWHLLTVVNSFPPLLFTCIQTAAADNYFLTYRSTELVSACQLSYLHETADRKKLKCLCMFKMCTITNLSIVVHIVKFPHLSVFSFLFLPVKKLNWTLRQEKRSLHFPIKLKHFWKSEVYLDSRTWDISNCRPQVESRRTVGDGISGRKAS